MMKTIEISEHVTLTISEGTLHYLNFVECMEIEDWGERKRRQLEQEQWERETMAWLCDPRNRDDVNYSDIYKDLYGVRPRQVFDRSKKMLDK